MAKIRFFVAVFLVCIPVCSLAQNLGFDVPYSVVELPSTTIPHSGDAVRCTIYPDVMIRISGTDTPAPDNALIEAQSKTFLPFKCSRTPPSPGIELKSAAFDLVGRIGHFLLFQAADPNGAGAIKIFDLRNGKLLFTDGANMITSVKLSKGVLSMNYDRGINATCSLVTARTSCWSALINSGEIPREAFANPPSRAACQLGYGLVQNRHKAQQSENDPSVISYAASLTLDSQGRAVVKSTGPLRCDPMP